MSAVLLRPLQPSDAGALAQVHAEAFDRPWPAEDFSTLMRHPGAVSLGAGAGPRLAGFILVRRVLDEAEVMTLAVRPAARRAGLARSLLHAAAEIVREAGAEALFLEVACDNAPALALYAGCGFAPAGVRRGYYARDPGPALDAQVMRRALNTGAP